MNRNDLKEYFQNLKQGHVDKFVGKPAGRGLLSEAKESTQDLFDRSEEMALVDALVDSNFSDEDAEYADILPDDLAAAREEFRQALIDLGVDVDGLSGVNLERLIRTIKTGLMSGTAYESDEVMIDKRFPELFESRRKSAPSTSDLLGTINDAVNALLRSGMDQFEVAAELRGLADQVESSQSQSRHSQHFQDVDLDYGGFEEQEDALERLRNPDFF